MNTIQTKAYGTSAATAPLQEMIINRRVVQPHDVEFEILYCGICHSDLHMIRNDFGGSNFQWYPVTKS